MYQCKKVIRLFTLTKSLAKKASKNLVHNSSLKFYKVKCLPLGLRDLAGCLDPQLCSGPLKGFSQTSDSMLSAWLDWLDRDIMVPLMFLARRLKVLSLVLTRPSRVLYRYWYWSCRQISDQEKTENR